MLIFSPHYLYYILIHITVCLSLLHCARPTRCKLCCELSVCFFFFSSYEFTFVSFLSRKRISFIDRIITYFTGKPRSNQQQPAIESEQPESTKPAEVDVSAQPEVVAPPEDTPLPPKVTPEPAPKPIEKPIVKPAPEAPAGKPVEPTKPQAEAPPAVEVKPEPKEQPKPAPAPKPVTPQEPTTNGQPKVTEPAKPAPPTPAVVVPAKVSEDDSLRSLLPTASAVVELPSSNEDSFIIVESQKPKPTTTTTTTNVKNSTLDFLKAEGGRGAAAAPAMPR